MISLSEVTVVTPCSRPKNIIAIYNSIKIASKNFNSIPYWHIVYDTSVKIDTFEDGIKYSSYKDVNSVFGNSQRNYGLKNSRTMFTTFLDDDTILHPDYFDMLHHLLKYEKIIVVGQENNNSTTRLIAHPNNVRECHIDTGQLLFPTKILQEFKWTNTYGSDGILAEQIFSKYRDRFLFFNSNLSIYNGLR